MKKSKIVVLSALSSAFATVFLVVGNFFPELSLSGAFLASLSMMPILTKRSYRGAVMAYLSTIILAGIFSGFFVRWDALFPFAVFLGLHPLVNVILEDKKVNKIVAIIIKDIWFVISLTLIHLVTKLYIGDNDFINKYIYPILIIGGALIFPLYDYYMKYMFKLMEKIIKRLKL